MEKDENKSIEPKNDSVQGNLGALRYFSDDSNFVFILKKTEKLTSAIYLITSFFDHEEPLRWKLRTLSSVFLSSSLKLKGKESAGREKATIDTESIILEIGSVLLVAKNSGLISEMNYAIINKEFNIFADFLAGQSKLLSRKANATLEATYFDVNLPQIGPKQDETTVKDNYEGVSHSYVPSLDVLDKMANGKSELPLEQKGQNLDESSMLQSGKPGEKKDSKALREFGAVAVKKNSRQSIIISLLRRKKEIMIKDVSPLIHGCSEKTIQRELLSMVLKGILKKHGEKRWSRYSLA